MADHPKKDAKPREAVADHHAQMASQPQAVTFLEGVGRDGDNDVLERLERVALDGDSQSCEVAINDLLARGISPEKIADFYIPTLARQLGDQWCVDELSFASVTIGVSRLQSMLRYLGPCWSGAHISDPTAPSLLLIVPADVYHTLGAIVLSGQIRRKGISVKLLLGARPDDAANQMNQTRYDAVFLSSSRGETLESLRCIVDGVKSSTQSAPPVIIGGTILEVERVEDVLALTGADHATKNPDEALKLCGLFEHSRNEAQPTHGS